MRAKPDDRTTSAGMVCKIGVCYAASLSQKLTGWLACHLVRRTDLPCAGTNQPNLAPSCHWPDAWRYILLCAYRPSLATVLRIDDRTGRRTMDMPPAGGPWTGQTG